MGVNAVSLVNRVLYNNTLQPKTVSTNAKAVTNTVLTHLNSGRLKEAVSILFSTPRPFPSFLYSRLFQFCSAKRAIIETRKLESHLVTYFKPPPTFLLNRAIEAYGKCGCLVDARGLFDEMPDRDGGSWNAMITAYSQGGCSDNALLLFSFMRKSGISANEITFASVLGSCAAVLDLDLSKQVHGLVVKCGLCCNVILGSSLVDIYGKCRVINDARRMFDEIQNPNAISWNVIVRRYLEMGEEKEAVLMFFNMIRVDVRPLNFTFSNALIACSSILAIKEGSQIHVVVVKHGIDKDEVVTNPLIDMYAKCGCLEDAHRIFDQPGSKNVISWTSILSGYALCGKIVEARTLFDGMNERSVVSWNAMLAGYTRLLQWEEAFRFVFLMRRTTKDIDYVTLGLILNVCAGLLDYTLGKQVHGFAYRHGFFSNSFVGNAILDMYSKCRIWESFTNWFSEMSRWRDRVSWNAFITGYARHKRSEEALKIFGEMQRETKPNEFDFCSLLAACANIFALEQGKQIHGYMLRNGSELDVVVRGALVDMYSKGRCLEYALKVFGETASSSRDVILWNSMILGCAHNGKGKEVLELFELMKDEGVSADYATFQGVLLACINEGLADLGKQYFNAMSNEYCVIPRVEHYECMIELFGRHGFMDELEDFVRNKMPFEATEAMLTRIFDACREHKHSRLGEWAAQCLNESKPLNPFRFEILSENAKSQKATSDIELNSYDDDTVVLLDEIVLSRN